MNYKDFEHMFWKKKISDDNSLLIIYKQTYMIHLRLSFNFIDIHS